PPIPGLSATECLTSDTFWDLSQLPQRLVVLGGGPSGCELAQAMARFGASVTIVEMSDRILIREDPDAAATVASALAADGVTLLTAHKAARIDQDGDVRTIIVESASQKKQNEYDAQLSAVARA